MIIYIQPWHRVFYGTTRVEPNHYVIDLIRSIDKDEFRSLDWNDIPPMMQLMYIRTDKGMVCLDSWKTWEEQGVGEGTKVYRVFHGRNWRHRPAGAA